MEPEVKSATESSESKVDRLAAHVIECAETRFDLIAIDVQEKVSGILASMASIAIIGTFIAFIVLLLTIAAAIYISEYYESTFIGFIYLAGFYAVLVFVLLISRKKVIKLPVINGLLKRINFHEEDQHTFGA
jgi:uncharacterized membrane protein YqjE